MNAAPTRKKFAMPKLSILATMVAVLLVASFAMHSLLGAVGAGEGNEMGERRARAGVTVQRDAGGESGEGGEGAGAP